MMKSKKKLTGLVVLLIGVVLFIFAKYEQRRVSHAKGTVSRGKSMFSGSDVSNTASGMIEGHISQYDTPLKLIEIGSIVLVVVGAGIFYFSRKKR